MIHETKYGTYVISSHGVWVPGVYESERAARYAFHFPNERLQALQDSVNHRPDPDTRVVTFEMLQAERRRLNVLAAMQET